jgi:hypothetical protein
MRKLQTASLSLSLTTILLLSSAASPQSSANLSVMQLAKLTASDGAYFNQFGLTAAISGDTAVVGALASRSEVYVFVKGTSGWGDMTQTATLAASDGTATLGGSVGISGDTIVVGSPGDYMTGVYSAYVYVKPSGGWSGSLTETAILTVTTGNNLGQSVAINGNTIVVGGYQNGGASYVFVKPAGGWKSTTQANATLITPFTQGPNPIAISGNAVVIGAGGNFGGQGSVYVYVQPSAGWSGTLNPTATLLASNAKLGDGLGTSVAFSGSTIVAGAYSKNQGAGAVYVFVEPSGGWVSSTETAQLTAPGTIDFGYSVGISGNTIAVGAPFTTVGFNQFQGAVYVYLKPSGGWKSTWRFNSELNASDGAPNDLLGYSTSINAGTIIAGAPQATVGANQYQGAAYVFGP